MGREHESEEMNKVIKDIGYGWNENVHTECLYL